MSELGAVGSRTSSLTWSRALAADFGMFAANPCWFPELLAISWRLLCSSFSGSIH